MLSVFGLADHAAQVSSAFGEPVIDLVHLARQCDGEAALEHELLGMFSRQAAAAAADLAANPTSSLDDQAKIAHTLKGSALAVGAGRVARAASAFERCCAPSPEEPAERRDGRRRALAALEAAVAEARAEIANLISIS